MRKHYIEVDENNYIIKSFSDAFEQPSDSSICVNTNGTRHFNLDLKNENGLSKKWLNNSIIDALPPISSLKRKKLQELDDYHYSSPDIRTLTINNSYVLNLDSKGRSLIDEQIQHLTNQISLGTLTESDASFEYFYENGSVTVSLLELNALYAKVMSIVNHNFKTYKVHQKKIRSLRSRNSIATYDYTKDYLRNQNIDIT